MLDTSNDHPIVMTFSEHDPSGGTGIQADIESLASCGCHCVPIVTAITAQDTQNVKDAIITPPTLLISQARAILEDMPVAAIKIGSMGCVENIEAINSILTDYPNLPVVLDPVITDIPSSPQSPTEMLNALVTLIFPKSTLVAPGLVETKALTPEADCIDASAREILEMGCSYVFITGEQALSNKVVNKLYNSQGLVQSYRWERLTNQYQGITCTLTSAISGYLAHGSGVSGAVERAQEFTWNALKHGRRMGMGRVAPNRFYWTQSKTA